MEGMFGMLYRGQSLLHQVADKLFRAHEKILVLSLGYGFNDPDLHPLWDAMISKCDCWFVVNERPAKGRRPSLQGPPSGRDVLRNELFERFTRFAELKRIESNLVVDKPNAKERNVLTEIVRRIGCAVSFGVPVRPAEGCKAEIKRKLVELVGAGPAHWVDDFLLNIVNTAARSDARALFSVEQLIAFDARDDAKARRLVNYMEQYANSDEKEDGVESAKVLRKTAEKAGYCEVCDLVLVFEGFLRCVRSPIDALRNLPWVLLHLYLPWRKSSIPAKSFARAFLSYYRLIIPVMCVHEALIRAGVLGVPIKWALRCWFRGLLRQSALLLSQLEELHEVKYMGSALKMCARLYIMLGDSTNALKTAERASLFATAGGRMTDSALADRWWAHAHLLNGDKANARKCYRRALARAVVCSDVSIRVKIVRDVHRLGE